MPPRESGLPRLLLFPGSLRRDAYQRRLIEYFLTLIGDRCEPDMLVADLPLFDQDLEQDAGVIERVAALHRRCVAADGFIVASPEYNGHVSPYVKNTVDWVSRLARVDARFADARPFRGKPLLLACASTGWTGGLLGLRDARTLFGYLGCLVQADQICVSDAAHWASEGPFRFEPAFADHIASTLLDFCRLAAALKTRDSDNGSFA
jgi:NAD(P)H-dependent FMN reductase